MYERDPRRDWTPLFGSKFHVQPWQLEDWTPMELDAALEILPTLIKAGYGA